MLQDLFCNIIPLTCFVIVYVLRRITCNNLENDVFSISAKCITHLYATRKSIAFETQRLQEEAPCIKLRSLLIFSVSFGLTYTISDIVCWVRRRRNQDSIREALWSSNLNIFLRWGPGAVVQTHHWSFKLFWCQVFVNPRYSKIYYASVWFCSRNE